MVQPFKLVIDGDPQGLERSRRRMNWPGLSMPGCACYQIGQLLCGRYGLALLALFNYPFGNAAGVSLFSVVKKNSCYLLFGKAKQKLPSGLLITFGIHPHVERGVQAKTESSRG